MACTDKAVRQQGYERMPKMKGPVAYSVLPPDKAVDGNNTGLAFQGAFGPITQRPELVLQVCICKLQFYYVSVLATKQICCASSFQLFAANSLS
jgi:hypothetical protein